MLRYPKKYFYWQTIYCWDLLTLAFDISHKVNNSKKRLVFPGYSNKRLLCEALFTCPDFLLLSISLTASILKVKEKCQVHSVTS